LLFGSLPRSRERGSRTARVDLSGLPLHLNLRQFGTRGVPK